MEAQFSVSQSLQASTITQQYLTKTQLEQQEQQQQQQQQHLTVWQQLKLTAALFGVESATAFEQVYTYLSLQYLGVPVALMTVNGIIAGVSAVILILVMGHLVDRGNNPKRRKLFALVFGLFLLVSGCLFIITASFLKIREGQFASNVASNINKITDTQRPLKDFANSTGSISNSKNATTLSETAAYSFNQFFRGNSGWPNNVSTSMTKDTIVVSYSTVALKDIRNKESFTYWPLSTLQPDGKILDMNTSEGQPSTAPIPHPQAEKAYIPLPGVLGILGFTCLDIGFDLGNPTCRAFILDHSPSSQHTHLLVTATRLASIAGLLMSCLGVFDLPSVIENLFEVDGTAGTFILMLIVIMAIAVSFFGCSIWTGLSLRKATVNTTASQVHDRRKPGWKNICDGSSSRTKHHLDPVETCLKHSRHEYKSSLDVHGADGIVCMKEQEDSGKEHNHYSTTTTNDKVPLLSKASGRCPSEIKTYSSFSSFPESNTNLVLPDHGTADAAELFQDTPKPRSKLEDIPEYPVNAEAITSSSPPLSHSISSEFFNTINQIEKNSQFDKFLGSFDETDNTLWAKTSLRESLTPGYDRRRQTHQWNNTDNSLAIEKSTSTSSPLKTPLLNKRLTILVISTAFSVSSLLGIVMYSSNAVTLGIYKADPKADVGTPGNLSYRQGLRTSAMGNVVFYISYFITCILNNKSFQLFGEKLYNMVCHGLFVIATALLILTQRVEAYFVVMVTLGPFRTCIFTLPYVLANKYTETKSGSGPADATRMGQVTATIGCSLPCTYIIVSSVMGPLIEATGNVWIPLIWTCIGCTISMAVFAVLFCIKD